MASGTESNKEETLAVLVEKSAKRLKAASGYMVECAEPMKVIQTLAWQLNMVRAEMTALRDMMKNKVLNTDEYQKRTVDYFEQYTSLIERSCGIEVSSDGTFVGVTKDFEGKKDGLHGIYFP